jgi:hypothetical protein
MPYESIMDEFFEDLNKAANTAVQSVLIPRSRYSESEARAWLKEHGYRSGKIDVTDKYYRFRQAEPGLFSRMRTKGVSGGIKLIIGWKK